jgi:enterochelin esterase-like enzyme
MACIITLIGLNYGCWIEAGLQTDLFEEVLYDTAREKMMSASVHSARWQLRLMPAVIILFSACTKNAAPIKGEAPLKATTQPAQVVAEPSATFTPEPEITQTPEECLESEGQLIEDSYVLSGGTDRVPLLIYLPPCYEEGGEFHYPVGYFLHGYPQDEAHWIELGVVDAYERLLSSDQITPMLLVFPFQPEPYFTQSDGGTGSLEEVLLDDVLGEVNAKYQVSTQARDHAILGVSRGGVWALEVGMRHPETFNIVAALSPALAYNHPRRAYDPFNIARSAEELPAHLLLSSGDREPQFSDEIDRFADLLTQLGVEFLYLRHEGRHEDSAWESIMDEVLQFVSGAMLEDRTIVLE